MAAQKGGEDRAKMQHTMTEELCASVTAAKWVVMGVPLWWWEGG